MQITTNKMEKSDIKVLVCLHCNHEAHKGACTHSQLLLLLLYNNLYVHSTSFLGIFIEMPTLEAHNK